jgi:hypothetical protein
MSWTYEIAMRGAPEAAAGLRRWLGAGPRQALTRLPGLTSLDLYTPAEGPAHDPYNHDGAGPLMMLMLDFASRDALVDAVKGGALANAHGGFPDGIAATGAAFERRFYPTGDAARPAPLEAPFSYVVRYHRPAEDEGAFIANYIATHPTTQAKLPGIRGIMCYLPLHDVAAAGNVATANYLIGNEVVFDDIAAFNVAMASPVRQELRAHYHAFPSFSGGNTHYPMTRARLAG